MDPLVICPPFSDEQMHDLKKTHVGLFIDGEERGRGMIISLDLCPADKRYSVTIEIDFSEYKSCVLGYDEKERGWVITDEYVLDETWRKAMTTGILEVRHTIPVIYAGQ